MIEEKITKMIKDYKYGFPESNTFTADEIAQQILSLFCKEGWKSPEEVKELQHFKDSSIGLWVTDRPDMIEERIAKYIEEYGKENYLKENDEYICLPPAFVLQFVKEMNISELLCQLGENKGGIDTLAEKMRDGGWLSSSDKIEGLNCTVGEALEKIGEMVDELTKLYYLINDSRGIDGFHLNGDIALWDEFDLSQNALTLTGGRVIKRS